MIEKVEGIILNEKSYGETSKIINLFTKEHGIIGLMAKGAKTMKSPLRSVTGKLTYGSFYIVYKQDKLSTLTNVDVINYFKEIKMDIDKISYASFLLELAEQVYRHNNNEAIYQLLIDALLKIEEGYDPMIITNMIELKYLDYLGVMPVLDGCCKCGSKTNITTLSSSLGGYLCRNCQTMHEHMNDPKTIKLIRMFYYVDISKIEKLEIKDKYKFEINTFLDEYYERYTGLYLKSKAFIQNLNKIVK